uniref:receptor protein serine/threonine kinase n=1 Tax=Sphaeramia orbicularis TaxID=375764 RepID=A0A672YP78_9TELE
MCNNYSSCLSLAEFIFISISSQSLLQKRQCLFHVKTQNDKYRTAGNVSGSVQFCEKTDCCVGYFLINGSQPEVDLLACDMAEKSCPDSTCKAQIRFSNHLIKCVCNTDLCNSNITWSVEPAQSEFTYTYSVGDKIKIVVIVFALLILCGIAAKWKTVLKQTKDPQTSFHSVAPLCSCLMTKTPDIDVANVELQQIVGEGYYATVWQGKYQGNKVAVKVFPAAWKQKFANEKVVYELPLMNHAGIVNFLGSGRKSDGSSWLIVLQFAEYGSLHSFLGNHTSSWMLSLTLCQSLSQGLAYLHSDLHRHDVHKPPVAHRDLSSANVLVRADGTCALSDFGCSTVLRSCLGHHCRQNHTRNTEVHPQVGTPRYMAPEILDGSVNLKSSLCLIQGDVYALGLLMWEIWMRCSDLFNGETVPQHLLPYESELEANVTLENLILYVFYMDKRPSIPKLWELQPQGSELQKLLTDCWDYDPDARLTAQCVADRLGSFQSYCSLFYRHLSCFNC